MLKHGSDPRLMRREERRKVQLKANIAKRKAQAEARSAAPVEQSVSDTPAMPLGKEDE